jgi:hypothetical protein
MSATAGKLSEIFDKFSSWLFVGYGGAVTFLITNADKLSNNVPPQTLRCAVQMLLPVAVFAIVGKYLAGIVGSASAGAAAGREIGEQFDKQGPLEDIRVVFAEMFAALYWPASWLARKSFEKMQAGDINVGARRAYKLAQVQGFLAIGQALFILYAIYQLATNVRF